MTHPTRLLEAAALDILTFLKRSFLASLRHLPGFIPHSAISSAQTLPANIPQDSVLSCFFFSLHMLSPRVSFCSQDFNDLRVIPEIPFPLHSISNSSPTPVYVIHSFMNLSILIYLHCLYRTIGYYHFCSFHKYVLNMLGNNEK